MCQICQQYIYTTVKDICHHKTKYHAVKHLWDDVYGKGVASQSTNTIRAERRWHRNVSHWSTAAAILENIDRRMPNQRHNVSHTHTQSQNRTLQCATFWMLENAVGAAAALEKRLVERGAARSVVHVIGVVYGIYFG